MKPGTDVTLQTSQHHTSQFLRVSNNKMADMQHFDAGSILVALNLESKCGVVLHIKKNVLFLWGQEPCKFRFLV